MIYDATIDVYLLRLISTKCHGSLVVWTKRGTTSMAADGNRSAKLGVAWKSACSKKFIARVGAAGNKWTGIWSWADFMLHRNYFSQTSFGHFNWRTKWKWWMTGYYGHGHCSVIIEHNYVQWPALMAIINGNFAKSNSKSALVDWPNVADWLLNILRLCRNDFRTVIAAEKDGSVFGQYKLEIAWHFLLSKLCDFQ